MKLLVLEALKVDVLLHQFQVPRRLFHLVLKALVVVMVAIVGE